MGPRAGLDGCGKSRLNRDLIPGPSSPLWRMFSAQTVDVQDVTSDVLNVFCTDSRCTERDARRSADFFLHRQ